MIISYRLTMSTNISGGAWIKFHVNFAAVGAIVAFNIYAWTGWMVSGGDPNVPFVGYHLYTLLSLLAIVMGGFVLAVFDGLDKPE